MGSAAVFPPSDRLTLSAELSVGTLAAIGEEEGVAAVLDFGGGGGVFDALGVALVRGGGSFSANGSLGAEKLSANIASLVEGIGSPMSASDISLPCAAGVASPGEFSTESVIGAALGEGLGGKRAFGLGGGAGFAASKLV